ncbi:hypothetical protein [Paenibacillus sp. Soil724D2]|uniref:hypothetical protein n=1 Tax=Paenibacillus sp. (strain Soil724D2) TaxID=1736392 RepID=UPI0009E79B39
MSIVRHEGESVLLVRHLFNLHRLGRHLGQQHIRGLISENKHLLMQEYRLAFHLMSEFGWINDPNGIIYHDGRYCMFYQHYPYKPFWGPM